MNETTDPALVGLLACPSCRGRLLATEQHLTCAVCGDQYPVVQGVPVLLPGVGTRSVPPRPSTPLPDDLLARLRHLDGRWLHIGAGTTAEAIQNRVELDSHLGPNTSVVGDLNRLPFVSEQFEAVVAYNVLERLPDPARAAAEIKRVLVPGGSVHVQVAFLQPEDATDPTLFRASEHGVRTWFAAFVDLDVRGSDVMTALDGRRANGV